MNTAATLGADPLLKHNLTKYRCLNPTCQTLYSLDLPLYNCQRCASLLEVVYAEHLLTARTPSEWQQLFASRFKGSPSPYGSGVWRYHEWVLPEIPLSDIVTLGEGGTPLIALSRLGEALGGVELLFKQCGQSLSGSFKDLGMTVLISEVNHLRKQGVAIPAVLCASTGDTSAALAAYGAAAGIPTIVLLPQGKITAAQLVQPLANGAKVVSIATDFDGCMAYVQRLATEEGLYLANSKNSLRIEGQKTVAFEIAEALQWQVPDWIAIPGGNLGNISALARGFKMLYHAKLIERLPRLLCVQVAKAAPLFHAWHEDSHTFTELVPVPAGATQASAIRIGNPVSFVKATAAIQETQGLVRAVSEAELTRAARLADSHGLYVCPHTAAAFAGVRQLREEGLLKAGERVVVVATAHGLKFTEFKVLSVEDRVPEAHQGSTSLPLEVADDYAAVRQAILTVSSAFKSL